MFNRDDVEFPSTWTVIAVYLANISTLKEHPDWSFLTLSSHLHQNPRWAAEESPDFKTDLQKIEDTSDDKVNDEIKDIRKIW